ncbi:MAG: amidohydrolase [Anaerolineales bacterium]|nr:amidohydrolase [Anaerolineales bacterium]
MTDFYAQAQALFPYSQAMRRDFHMHPELGFQEVRTSGIIAKELRELGMEVSTGIAKTGVIGLIEGAQPGPVVMLRFDIDALPIHEETGAAYASQTPGLMHACGHDGHAAIGLTVAKLLHAQRENFSGTFKLVFQPAEEGLGGAETMVKEGAMESPQPVRTLGLHIWNSSPLGWLGIAAGPVMAGASTFKIVIRGKGGHGAIPHLSIDPILASAQIISALQSIVSRNVNAQKAAVVTVASIHAGEAFNVIPPQVEMTGTLRYFEPEIGETVQRRMEEILEGVAAALECQAEIEISDLTPPVINDAATTACVLRAAKTVFPAETPDTAAYVTMGSEDFSFFQQKAPGTYFFVGSNNDARGLNHGHHHPKFDFDEETLVRSAALMTAAALEVIQNN